MTENNNSTKKLVLPLLIIIAVMVALVGGATFAYFAASTNTTAAANVNMNQLPAGAGSCQGSGSGTVTAAAITASDMQNSTGAISATIPKTTATSNNIVMTATAPDNATIATCTYNVTWTWTSNYTPSTGLDSAKELTYTLEKYNGSSWATVGTLADMQFVQGKSGDVVTLTSTTDQEKTENSTTVTGTSTYRITLKWYNVNVDQSAHEGAIYSGTLGFSNPSIALRTK